jgi:hypothetical protein
MMQGQRDRTIKAVVLLCVGGLSALLGLILTPYRDHMANTYPVELYLPTFFMLIGAGMIVLGAKKLVD